MKVLVAGQHITLTADLQEYVKDRVQQTVLRYFEGATSANVHFSKEGRQVLCDIVVHEGSGGHLTVNSEATSDEIYNSFDLAMAKSEKRLRKYKSKLKDRGHRVKVSQIDTTQAKKYTICGITEEKDDNGPLIIAETGIHVPRVTVSEAVMKLGLEDLPALMFQNAKTDRMNVVYIRKDGNIAWVDHQ